MHSFMFLFKYSLIHSFVDSLLLHNFIYLAKENSTLNQDLIHKMIKVQCTKCHVTDIECKSVRE